ncbi:putative permease [Dyadobacter sp. BE34]|uniref:Permease n=1 Tax=Dyadobacter fermentans TaxID=94254 RepID=A0ABU1QTL8_9BACT|nr:MULTISPECIES: ABC transporter permease [Dyadobacter]MDR6804486.1 putative permease [Dyadobacter fermentans]MDR7042226.1 putative permease [Dyadobacter sp. BE242]MDR7196628.1 putative permease [Dyadobacter sp. BE34]MDR7212826.1 putative permease [Dyadobacter sp. BE31]MDR7262035.1 putative permease [Dyadobacter sp. BE32]
MLKNYLKIAFRNLLRNKAFSSINILGLSVGMASAVLILFWMYNEISYDRFHKNKDYLYEAWNRGTFDGKLQCWNSTPQVLGPTLKTEYPEVSHISRNYSRWFVTRAGDKKISSEAIITDPAFLSMFDFPLLQGNAQTALNSVGSMVVTQKMAIKMFGTEDVLGKVISIDQDNFTITGVMRNLPPNTAFKFEYILPIEYLKKIGSAYDGWMFNSVHTYVQLKSGTNPEAFAKKIRDITIRHSNKTEEHEVFLHPISQWHLYSNFENGKVVGGRIAIVRLFGIIAAFILLIACINFMNLSTARSEKRAKEVGIRKTAGAPKSLLVGQFIGESILIAMIAGTIALLAVYLTLPAFNTLIGKELEVPVSNPAFWTAAFAFILFTGIVAGSYPAFYLSSFKPISVLKGAFKRTHSALSPRKVLVVVQFSFAIVLIISTLIVVQQIRHAQNRDAGYDRGQVVYHWITGDLGKQYAQIKRELLSGGIATSVTKTSSPLSSVSSDTWGIEWQGKNMAEKIDFDIFTEDEGLVKTAGLQLIQGRDMDLTKFPSDSAAVLLNETAAKIMGFKDPIGQTIKDNGLQYRIVGVVKDFVIRSPYDRPSPLIIEGAQSYFNVIHIKLTADKPAADVMPAVEAIFRRYNPEYPFEYHFVDEDYALKFEDTRRVAKLTGIFAGLTIFISCLGLFGLAAYMAENRVKEIGVRKVLGASVMSIAALLSGEFMALVIISIVIAVPVAWYVMNLWLNDFEYRVGIQWWIFAVSGFLAIVVSLATVSYQAIRAALLNPVKSLRSE